MNQPSSALPTTPKASLGTLVRQGLIGAAAAGVVNLGLYFASRAAGIAYEGDFNGQPSIPVPAIFLSGVIMLIPATLVARLAQRFTANAARTYLVVAIVFLLLSLGGPPGVKGLGLGAIVVMEVMHLVAAIGLGGLQYRALQRGA